MPKAKYNMLANIKVQNKQQKNNKTKHNKNMDREVGHTHTLPQHPFPFTLKQIQTKETEKAVKNQNCEGTVEGPLLTLRGQTPFLPLTVVFTPGTPVLPTCIPARRRYKTPDCVKLRKERTQSQSRTAYKKKKKKKKKKCWCTLLN